MHSLAEDLSPPGRGFVPADRVARLGTETVFAVSAEAAALAAQGRTIYPFHLGDLNIPTAEPHRRGDAARPSATARPRTAPTPASPRCARLWRPTSAPPAASPTRADDVSVQPGGKPVIGKWLMAAMNMGDEVLYPNPGFPIYASFIEFVGGVAVPYGYVDAGDRYAIDIDAIERRITPRTRLLILNDLHNPTAAECTSEELDRIAEIALKHDLLVLSDEAYFDVRFEGASRVDRLAPRHAGAHRHPVHVQQEVRDDGVAPGRRDRPQGHHRHHHAHEREHGVVPQPLRPVRRPRGAHRRPGRAPRDDGPAQGTPRRGAPHPERDAGRALPHAGVHVLPVSGRHRRRPPDRLRRSRGLPAPPPRQDRRLVLHPAALREGSAG